MDQNSEIINDFESLLMTRSTKRTPALYASNENQNITLNSKTKTYSAREVLTNVSKQLKAIQNADTATHKRVNNKLDKYKKREFLPIDKIPVYKEVPKNIPTKFETQCVTDTQLIHVIENAEIIDRHRGVTQEFDESFCQKSDEDDCDNKINDGSLKPDKIANKVIGRSVNSAFVDKEEDMKEFIDISDQDSKLFEKSDILTCEMATVTCQEIYVIGCINDEVNINASQETQEFHKRVTVLDESNLNEKRSISPVLNAIKRNSTPPLVVNLYTFEEFENLAHPIIDEQGDFEMAKNLINSQILGREISIPDHIYESFNKESPVSNKMECITTNMNKDYLDNVNTHSDEYVDSNIISNQGNCSSEKKEMESKVIKAEIKDEILFSSDEEYEYLHKDVQELPLTCALETSFYDKSDVLDKTMYVGFQTASNKSIQIHTDSFMRAKNILSSVDTEKTEATLKDLVEIFDTGKAVNDNVQNTALTSCKQEHDTENKSLLKLEIDNNEDFTLVSQYRGKHEEKIGDTFKNVSLTALEKEANVNDDIVMSQVITCKNKLRSAKENNYIIFEHTTSDTLNTAIEQNKHLDDDVIMSQVIEFKSISRTPKSVINTSINDILKKPEELNTKRKLEGFKTASNKKIKLSDIAMARCKKVFQDIDLNETECLTNSESKKELNSGEIQPKIEDLDLQINDKIILQEFEHNDMSFEIRHNNTYVGFKTASNKNISISDTALAKTKSLFQDIMNTNTENDYLKESAEKCTNSFKKPVIDFKKVTGKLTQTEDGAFAKTKTVNEGAIALGIKEDNPNIDMICIPSKRDFSGFKKAANKEIKISDQASEKSKDFYKALDENPTKNIRDKEILISNMEKEKLSHVEEEFNCGIDTQDFFAEELTHVEDLFKDNAMERKKPLNPTFHGFQTASKIPVVISKIALEKGRKFFEDITNTESNLIDNTNIQRDGNPDEAKTSESFYPIEQETDSAVVQTAVKEAVSEITLEDITRFVHKSDSKDVNSDDPIFTGFKTASSKPIIVSAAAMENTKRILTDFELEDDDVTVDNNLKQIIQPKPSTSTFVGFQTASNQKIKISAKALAKSKQILNDFEYKDDLCEARNNTSNENLENRLIGHHDTSNFGMKADDNITPSTSKFIGFQTASNKEIKISNEALVRSKVILEDHISENEKDMLDEVAFEPEGKASPKFKGFQTSQNKKDSISEKALEESKRLFQDIDADNYLKDENLEGAPIFRGFQTATNKKVPISERALAKSKKLFEDIKFSQVDPEIIQLVDSYDSPVFTGFQTASNKKVPISGEALVKSKQLFEDIKLGQIDKETTNLEDAPKGFQTTSNKKVEISEKALANSKQLFKDIKFSQVDKDPEIINLCDAPVFTGFQTASNKKVEISEQALANSKQLFENMKFSQVDKETTNHEDAPVFKGFQTASNKKVEISEKALAKSKKLFEDIKLSQLEKDHETNHIQELPVFKGFQTASNKKVEISEKALANSKQLFKDIKFSQIDPEIIQLVDSYDSPVFTGFQTASNKKVPISGEALVKSKQLFEDIKLSQIDKETTNLEDAPKGFQTTSNKKVEIFEKALANNKQLFKDIKFSEVDPVIINLVDSDDCPVFTGFQTASNKKVEISEKALAKSKKLFEDIKLSQLEKDHETNHIQELPVFKGFQTASNKTVEISEQALAKSKLLLEDIKFSEVDKDPETTNLENAPVFKGFQTASNKKVPISEKALAKCKQVFEGLNQLEKDLKTTGDLNDFPAANENNDAVYKINEPFGNENFKRFETGNNEKVKVSKQALAKTKNIFKDIHEGIKTPDVKIKNHSKVYRIPNNNLIKTDDVTIESSTENANALITDVIDTQVLNDFQDTQNTNDFCKSPPRSKRSGSPILSCPRAKKRKFETPYRTKKKIEPLNTFVPPKVSKTFNFNAGYKNEKKFTLKDLQILEREHTKIEINPYIAEFKFDTLLNFKFFNTRNDYTEGTMTIGELKKVFLDSVNKEIVPDGWLDNHIKLILWKLLSYEIKYPNVMKNTCTVRNVLEQLKYRYDRELYHVQRPILRKILEKDEVASKTMVLCVAEIYVDNISVTSVSPIAQNMELLLTDGWYCVKATTDRMLVRLAPNGSIMVGTKIAVCGAELINCEQGVAPWEDTSSVRLKLSGNSVRRARWLTPLGVRTDIVRCPLRAVRVDGGRVAALRVAVARVYPPLYVEKMDDGSTVTLSERLENIRQSKYESERQAVMEKLYEEVEKEMSDQDSQDSEGCSNERSGLESGSQISKCMKRSKDPDEYRSHLTKSQTRVLEEHNAIQRDKLIERVRVKFQEKLDKTGLKMDRNVIPLLKVRITGLVEKDGVEVTKGYLSIWRPSAAVLELLTEGAWIEILNIIPTGIRNSEIQLSAGRQTVFNPYKQTNEKFKLFTNTSKRKCYEIGELTHNSSMTTDYNEIDTVGIIFCIEPSSKEFKGNQNFQNVYLADADKNIICVNFWGGIKKFGFHNLLDTGQIVTCVNLQKRAGNTRKCIPEYRVTEFTYFTKTPKDKKALEITNELSNKLSKIKEKFCEDCVVLKNNYSVFKTRNNENVSPYSNCNVKMVSPLKNDLNLNLTGLDFDTSFDTQDISPQMLLRKKKINEKIEKIRLYYGEPPPLSSIHIVNQSKNASANYKSPLVLNLERPNVANVQNTGLVESPVTMNRTFVKNINPVKLNFSNASLNDNVDHFAEEFDASPPLSLDSDTLN